MPNTKTRGYIIENLEELTFSIFSTTMFFFLTGFALYGLISNLFIPTYPITFENYQHLSTSQYIYSEAERAGVDPIKALMVVDCESHFQNILHVNKDKSVDRGYWQISDKWHKEVSLECSTNLACSTREALRIIKQRGFAEWQCGRILGIK